jgi:hypothetical protein
MSVIARSFASKFLLKVTLLGSWATWLPLGVCVKAPIIADGKISVDAVVAD